MMHRKNLVIVQPTANITASKLALENAKIVKILRDAPIAVNSKAPHTYELLNISKHTSPRDARLERERDFEIEMQNARSFYRVESSAKKFSISTMHGFSPFKTQIQSNWHNDDNSQLSMGSKTMRSSAMTFQSRA